MTFPPFTGGVEGSTTNSGGLASTGTSAGVLIAPGIGAVAVGALLAFFARRRGAHEG